MLIQKAMAKDPAARFSTAAELAGEFARVTATGTRLIVPSQPKSPAIPEKKSTSSFTGWIIALAFVVIALIAGGFWLWKLRQANPINSSRCTTVETCERNAHLLATADRPLLSIEAYLRAISLVPIEEQTVQAKLLCDMADAYTRLNKKAEARNAYKECIAWTHDDSGQAGLRQYAQQRLKEMK
jgi:hypothetical protein